MFTHHCYIYSLVYMHWLFLSSCHMDHRSYYMYYCCMYIPVTWLFPVTDTDIPVNGHVSFWYAMCEIPHLLFLVSCYLVLYYQQSSYPIIILHVPCTVFVPNTLCTLNVLHISWGWGRLDGCLDLVGWMFGFIVCHTAGDMIVLATFLFPVSRYLFHPSGLALVSAARESW